MKSTSEAGAFWRNRFPFNAATIRRYFIWQHRWAGLLITGFLFVAGLTGTILAFDREIDEWLIPEMTHVPVQDVSAAYIVGCRRWRLGVPGVRRAGVDD